MTNNMDFINPSEYGLYVAYEAEHSFNEMMQEIGIAELHSFEENGAVVLEATDKKANAAKKNAVKEFFKRIWDGIVKIWNKVLNFIKSSAKKVSEHMAGYGTKKSELKSKLRLMKDTNSKGKTIDFGEIRGNADKFLEIAAGKGRVWSGVVDMDAGMSKVITQLGIRNNSMDYLSYAKDEIDDAKKKFRSALGISGDSASDIHDGVRKAFGGEKIVITRKVFESNFDMIWSLGKEYNDISSKIKGAINASKASIDKSIKQVEDLFKKDEDTPATAMNAILSGMKDSKQMLVSLNNAIIAELRTRHGECSRALIRLAVAAKNMDASKVNESAIVPSNFQTELASLFSF